MEEKLQKLVEDAFLAVGKKFAEEREEVSKFSYGILDWEIYPDENAQLSAEEIDKICSSEDPTQEFLDFVTDHYFEEIECNKEDEIVADVLKYIVEHAPKGSLYERGLTEEEEDEIREYVCDCIEFIPLTDQFLDQTVLANIVVEASDKATHFWLAAQQGHSIEETERELRKPKERVHSRFLRSLNDESERVTPRSKMVFFVKMSVEEYMTLSRLLRGKKEGRIVLDYDVRAGYFAQNVYKPRLSFERDVEIPFSMIKILALDDLDFSFQKNSCFTESIWQPAVKEIVTPIVLD